MIERVRQRVPASNRVRGRSIRQAPSGRTPGRRRRRWARWAAVAVGLAAVGVAVFLLAGRGSDPSGPRALTEDEANRLAVARFRNYEARGRAVTITVPGTAGGLTVTGSVDYRGKVGYGVVRGTGRAASGDGLIQWTATSVYVHPLANPRRTRPRHRPARAGTTVRSRRPAARWTVRWPSRSSSAATGRTTPNCCRRTGPPGGAGTGWTGTGWTS